MNKNALEIAMKEFENKKANVSIVKIAEDGVGISDRNELTSNGLIKDATLLNPSSEVNETDKADKAEYSNITNDDWLFGLFGEPTLDLPIAVSFEGNPATVKGNSWYGKPYVKGKTLLPSHANNYVSFATYHPNSNGEHRRTKAQFAKLNAIMLDDVGVKVQIDRILLTPSWVIETSAGNYQYGYILAEPICNADEATNLLDSIISAGLCDPGASGACARIGRLPVAVNGKTNFQCHLEAWNPHLRYTVKELVDGLKFELKGISKGKPRSQKSVPHDYDVHIPKDEVNPVIAELINRGLYKQPLGNGKHDITCYRVDEHTDQSDNGTAYWEPTELYPTGGFKCMHGHCADRNINSLHSHLDIPKDAAKHLPTIRISAGEINRIVDSAEIELSKTTRHYQRGGIIVTVATDPATNATNVNTLSLPSLTRILAGIALWQRFDKRAGTWVTCDPSERHVKILHSASQYPHLPILNGIARQPYFRTDFTLVTKAGYDPSTGLIGVFDSRHFNMPENPTREDAENALMKLIELLSEFSFKDPIDQSATLSAIITATVRPSLPLAPMFHVKAPQIASGKSFLCELIMLFATPEKSTPHSFPSEEDEMRKLLLAELITSPAGIEFDNLTSDLIPHKSLCTALTSQYMSGRILGQSKTAEVSTKTLFLSSGNNVDPIRDMTRRTVTINLDPKCETPATRSFSKNPINDMAKNRAEFIACALIIVRAWVIAGKPNTNVKPLNSYGVWSDFSRQPLLWLGLPDPAACVFESMTHDPSREELINFIEAVNDRYGFRSFSVKNIIEDFTKSERLKDALPHHAFERDGYTINKGGLGWWIKKKAGIVANGLRLVADLSVTSNTKRWQIRSISESITDQSALSALSVLSAPDSEFSNKLTISSFDDDDDDTSNDFSIEEHIAKYQDPIKALPITKTTEPLSNIPRNIKPDKFTYENVRGLDS